MELKPRNKPSINNCKRVIGDGYEQRSPKGLNQSLARFHPVISTVETNERDSFERNFYRPAA